MSASTAWVALNRFSFGEAVIVKTGDGGTTWVEQTTAFPNLDSFVNVVHFFDENDGVALGDVRGGISSSTSPVTAGRLGLAFRRGAFRRRFPMSGDLFQARAFTSAVTPSGTAPLGHASIAARTGDYLDRGKRWTRPQHRCRRPCF